MDFWSLLRRRSTPPTNAITPPRVTRENWRPPPSLAFNRKEQGDWEGALAVCVEEAKRLPDVSPVLELNILICKYHLGYNQGLAERAVSLAKRHRTCGIICCWGLAMITAHRAGELDYATRVACLIAEHLEKPWDLPTVPSWVYPFNDDVVVMETMSTDVVLGIVEDLRDMATSSEQRRLLGLLAERYRERAEASTKAAGDGSPA